MDSLSTTENAGATAPEPMAVTTPAAEVQTQSPAPESSEKAADQQHLAQSSQTNSEQAASLLDREPVQVPDKFKNKDGSLNSDALLKSYLHLEKRQGAGEAPPKDADGYKVETELGFEIDAERMASFKKGAHAVGVNNKQLNYILGYFNEIMTEGQKVQAEAEAKRVADADAFLKETWQGEYEGNLASARKAFDHFKAGLSPEIQERLMAERNQLGNMPGFLALAAAIGRELGEDKVPTGGESGAATHNIVALMKSEAYTNRKHPDHDRIKAEVQAAFGKGFKL